MSTTAVLNAAQDVSAYALDLFAGVAQGDLLSIAVVGILALIVLRFTAARWVYLLTKQLLIFGGLGFAVWWSGQAVQERYGDPAGQFVLYGGFGVVGLLLFAMLYMFFLKRSRGFDFEQVGRDVTVTPEGEAMRVGAGALQGQGLPVHREKRAARVQVGSAQAPKAVGGARATAAGGGGGGGSAGGSGGTPAVAAHETGRIEDVLQKINVLGATKDQNLLTVMVLILVAQFGVFTSKTISAPDPQVGMVLFAVFALGAVVFVKTSYRNYWTGVRHFVFATVFALGLSLLMLVYWQQVYCPAAAGPECEEAAQQAITWAVATRPEFYFQSDALIATITSVAFSTLLTKGGS